MTDTFTFRGHELSYLHHPYNTTRLNERAVEVPIAEAWCDAIGIAHGVEIGNVLAHYGKRPEYWGCVDLTEQAEGVTNEDIRVWEPLAPLDAAVAISTFEHVGWDDGTDLDGAWPAIERVASMLAPGGAMLVTLPMGQNPPLDTILLEGRTSALTATTLVGHPCTYPNGPCICPSTHKPRAERQWTETDEPEWRPYIGHSGMGAGAVWIGQYGRVVL